MQIWRGDLYLFQKKLPSPHRGGWISRLFLVEYSPRFGIFWTKYLFSYRFPQKFHKCAQNPQLFIFSLWVSRKILKNSKWNSRLFAFVALTSTMGEGNNLTGIAHQLKIVVWSNSRGSEQELVDSACKTLW